MTDWSLTFPPEIIYYIMIPIALSIIPAVFAWVKRREVTAVRNYVLEELREDIKELKERVSNLESRWNNFLNREVPKGGM